MTIKEQIADWENRLATQTMLPEKAKEQIRGVIKGLKEQEAKEGGEKPIAETKPAMPPKEAKAIREPKEKKEKKVKEPKKTIKKEVVSKGKSTTKLPVRRGRKPKIAPTQKPKKEYKARLASSEDEPDCDTLLNQFRDRRKKAKQSSKKRKTQPVFRKIASDVADAVQKAIKNVPTKKIKQSPKEIIKKFGALQKSAEAFLRAFKNILGADYRESQANAELDGLEKLINSLMKKYNK